MDVKKSGRIVSESKADKRRLKAIWAQGDNSHKLEFEPNGRAKATVNPENSAIIIELATPIAKNRAEIDGEPIILSDEGGQVAPSDALRILHYAGVSLAEDHARESAALANLDRR